MPAITLVDSVTIDCTQLAVGVSVLIRVGFHWVRGWGMAGGILVGGVGFLSGAIFALGGIIGSALPIALCSVLLASGIPSVKYI
jgi:hypothetical protein